MQPIPQAILIRRPQRGPAAPGVCTDALRLKTSNEKRYTFLTFDIMLRRVIWVDSFILLCSIAQKDHAATTRLPTTTWLHRRVWMDGCMDVWMDVWMDGWRNGYMDGWMDGCMDGWVDGWRYGWMDRCMDGWMHGCMDGWMDVWMDVWMDQWMYGWMDGCMYGCMDVWMNGYIQFQSFEYNIGANILT